MCWSVPGKIMEIDGKIAVVEVSGIRRKVALDLIDDIVQGDYVLIHAGYAIQKVDEAQARFTIDFFGKKGKDA